MSSNQGTAGHEWGFVRGMASQPTQTRRTEDAQNPATARSPQTPEQAERQVTVFAVGDHYLFTGQFTDDDVLDTLAEFYNRHQGRFEVDQSAIPRVEQTLASAGYEVVVVTDPSRYAVVVDTSDPHPERVLADAVFTVNVGDTNVFVLPTTAAVAALASEHVTPFGETPLRLSLSATADVGPVTVRDVATSS